MSMNPHSIQKIVEIVMLYDSNPTPSFIGVRFNDCLLLRLFREKKVSYFFQQCLLEVLVLVV